MRLQLLVVCISLAPAGAVWAQADGPVGWRGLAPAAHLEVITRADAVARARKASFAARRAAAHAETVEAQEGQARSLFLPTVALGAAPCSRT